ncbi:hypothetical protein TruAng_005519 [Truncatella angustata]|nr:hypothetical protein TruAng_005519 [Truncatella angustata]
MPRPASSFEVPSGISSSPGIEGNAANERTPLLNHDGKGNCGQSDRVIAGYQVLSDPQVDEATVTPQELPFSRLAIIFSTAWVGVFLGAIDSSVIATLTVPISSEFRSLSLLPWLATAYLISNAVCQPLSGRLTDIFGRGPGLVFSHIAFSVGNLICGLATNAPQMILGRVIAGIGGGGLMSIATFLGSDLVPLRKRGVVQGMLNLCFGSGAMLGGVIGGLLNDYSNRGWRLAFLIQVPPSLLAAVGVHFFIRTAPKQSQKSYLARIDFFGVFLLTSFLVLFLVGLNTGGNIVPWTHPVPLTTIPMSVVAFFSFIWWELRAVQPVIPVNLLLKRTVLAACLSNFFCTMVIFGLLFYIPLYLQVRGRTATEVGLLILFSPMGSSVSSVGAGVIMNKTGKYIGLGIASVIVMILGVIIFGFHNENTHDWMTAIVFFLVGTGYASMLTTTLLACIAAVEHTHQAVVTAATYLGRSLGSTLGITISSAVYQNILNDKLWDRFGDYPDAAKHIARIRNDVSELKHLPEGWVGVRIAYEASHPPFNPGTRWAMS